MREYLKMESKNKKKEINKGVKLDEVKAQGEGEQKKQKKEKGCC